MNTINKFFFLLIIVSALFITSCVDNDFDEPENTLVIEDADIMSIGDLLALLPSNGGIVLDESAIGAEVKYIKGTVTADDASGNFFKTITFQDETAALSIAADRNELNAEFPAGNSIYVRLNGLTLGYDANLPRLGYVIEDDRLQRIPDLLVNDFMIAGGVGEVIDPRVVTISEISQNSDVYFNKLVSIEQAEFTLGFVGQPYADADNPDGPQSTNAMIEDCDDNEIILRNSGFSDFAREIIPSGSGKVTGIISVFNDDLQMFIRDLNDVDFMELRCDGSGGQATNELEIESIKSRYYVSGADQAESGFITGTVISDRNTGQLNGQNVFFQNGEHGILVRFASAHSFNLGDELKITVSGQEVSEFKGLLQVNNVPVFNAEKTGSGDLPAAKEITIDEILLDNNRYESTRVLIKDAELSGGSTYGAGNITVDDGTETISIFTFNTTSYANEPVPSGMVNVTAIVSQFEETPQLMINAASDVSGGTIDPGGNGSDGQVNQTFEGFTDFDPVSIGGWLNVATKGDRQWYTRSFDNNGFVECEAFNDDNPATEAWLVTPTIDTDDKSIFSFETAIAFWQHQGLSVWISQDFSALNDANWVSLDEAVLADSGNENYEYVASGDIELTDYLSGKVRIGFKYEGTAAQNTTKVRIDNVELK
ncbi:MAG: hypothetical protein ACI86M_003133 [Saprospiraceae bacterium]|jgi:hypothetical protein